MAANTIPLPCSKSNLTRRAALHGAASVGAAVLPAGAAMAAPAASSGLFEHFVQTWMDNPEAFRRFAGIAPSGTDPLIDLWRKREEFRAIADAFDAELRRTSGGRRTKRSSELEDQREQLGWWPQWAIERQIATTTPVSPEGVAIVATVQLAQIEQFGDDLDLEHAEVAGGLTLARYILANTPADVLRRAGLEAVA